MIRRIRPAASSTPRPQPSTPQLFETTTRSPTPAASTAPIRVDGMPQSPKPPTASRAPSGRSAMASAGSVTTLSMGGPPGDGVVQRSLPGGCDTRSAYSRDDRLPMSHTGRGGPDDPTRTGDTHAPQPDRSPV